MNYELRIWLLLSILLVLMAGCKDDNPGPDYPTDRLVSYYAFDNDLKDAQGNSPTGVASGGVQYVDGYRNQGLSFDGIDGIVTVDRGVFHSNDQVSVSLWFKVDQANPLLAMISCNNFKFNTGGPGVGFSINHPATNSATGDINYGEWTHVAGTYDGNNIRLYINGEFQPKIYHPGTLSAGGLPMELGHFLSYWEGSMDELFIYNKKLSASEVAQLYER
ncbi:MAG: LamG domain-containing protein [Bacteroidetes bacterium]|nr:LamG domain-containing protein [Bacteroidota bacterium]